MAVCPNQVCRFGRSDILSATDAQGTRLYGTITENGAAANAPAMGTHPVTGRQAIQYTCNTASGDSSARSITRWNLQAARFGFKSADAEFGSVPTYAALLDLTYQTNDAAAPSSTGYIEVCRIIAVGGADLIRITVGNGGAYGYRIKTDAQVLSAVTAAPGVLRDGYFEWTPSSDGVTSDGTFKLWITSDGGENWTQAVNVTHTHQDGVQAHQRGARISGGLGTGKVPISVWGHYFLPLVPAQVATFMGGPPSAEMVRRCYEPLGGFSFDARHDKVFVSAWQDPATIKASLAGKTCTVEIQWQTTDPEDGVSVEGTVAGDQNTSADEFEVHGSIEGLNALTPVWFRFQYTDNADSGNVGTSIWSRTRTLPSPTANITLRYSAYSCVDDGVGHVAGGFGLMNTWDLHFRVALGDTPGYLDNSSARENKAPQDKAWAKRLNGIAKSQIYHALADEAEINAPSDHQWWDAYEADARIGIVDKYGVNPDGDDGDDRATECEDPHMGGTLGNTKGQVHDYQLEAWHDLFGRGMYRDSWAAVPASDPAWQHRALWTTFKAAGVRIVMHDTRSFLDKTGDQPTSGGAATNLGAIQRAWMTQELAPLLADSLCVQSFAEGLLSPPGNAPDDEMFIVNPAEQWWFEQFMETNMHANGVWGGSEGDRHSVSVHRYFGAGGWASRPTAFTKGLQVSRCCPICKGMDYDSKYDPDVPGARIEGIDTYSVLGVTPPVGAEAPRWIMAAGYVEWDASTRTRRTFLFNGNTLAAVSNFEASRGAAPGRHKRMRRLMAAGVV